MEFLVVFASMYAQDISGVCMMVAEARQRAVLAGYGDVLTFLFGWICLKYTIPGGFSPHVLELLAVITLANFWGSFTGVKISGHIHDPAMQSILDRLDQLEGT